MSLLPSHDPRKLLSGAGGAEHAAEDAALEPRVDGQRVVALPGQARRAYDLLAKQPVSLLGLSTLERSLVLAATDEDMVGESLTRVEALQRLDAARMHVDSLFFTVVKGHVSLVNPVMSFGSCNDALARLAKAAGVSWTPRNHECRRTFAWTIANSRIGRFALIFLKWQLKHSTISMTQLYASNPHQDQELYNEVYEATVEAQTEVLMECFGRAGPTIAMMSISAERALGAGSVRAWTGLLGSDCSTAAAATPSPRGP